MDLFWKTLLGEVVKGGFNWFKTNKTEKILKELSLKVESVGKTVIVLFVYNYLKFHFYLFVFKKVTHVCLLPAHNLPFNDIAKTFKA